MKRSTKRKLLIISISIISTFAILIGACAIYFADYYHYDEGAIAVFSPDENITVSALEDGNVVFAPKDATTGFIFYPGGKVEHNSYQPLMAALARKGVLCVLVEMPFNLAVFDINAADGIQEKYPNIEKWYIGGHSLGGSMAASYISSHTAEYDGLVLLGSYSTADISNTNLDVISIYGSEDKVLNFEKYNENKSNLPADFTEIIIDGGCHAHFGMYGPQKGDGKPFISNSEQIRLTVENIVKMINKD